MRKLLFVIVLLASALPLAAAQASSSKTRFAPAPYAGQCGLPLAQPIWMEFGWPTPEPGMPAPVLGYSWFKVV